MFLRRLAWVFWLHVPDESGLGCWLHVPEEAGLDYWLHLSEAGETPRTSEGRTQDRIT